MKMDGEMDRNEHWLTRGRVRLYSFFMLCIFLMLSIGFVRYSNLVDPKGYSIYTDLFVFWGASHFALTERALDAYNITAFSNELRGVLPDFRALSFGWFYPPTFYLVIFPLALLPYFHAYLAFMSVTLGCFVVVFRNIIRSWESLLCLAAFSGLWFNLYRGQNGYLTVALAGAALINLERWPIFSGVFIGLLSMKPHLAVLFPLALIAVGAWRTFFTAVIVALAFMSVSTVVLGSGTFAAWLQSIGQARMWTETGIVPWSEMPTIFSFLRLLGVPVTLAYAGHFLVAASAIMVMWKVWRNSPPWPLRGAALTTATLLVSPYLFDYDLVWLTLPIAWFAKSGFESGWLRGEREVLVAAWLLPLLAVLVAKVVPLQIGPWVLMMMLWMILRRVRIMRHPTIIVTHEPDYL
ncbi:glycosyltransferase family 87 protein [Ferrovum sp.]|uniref:glycosyltransferase family 87 protein n=1 Tax=Ferrovum sp. TaxID=2609467 RepID=UPI00262B943D|nr:glycosyltransferase family 87 protein [Ferrovum sp.]